MMPLAPQLSVPHIGQISASPTIVRNPNMKASKPKLSFSIDSIVGGKRKAFESEAASRADSGHRENELLAKSIKRQSNESMIMADLVGSDRRSSASPSSSSCGHRSPDLGQHRHSVSPLSSSSLSGSAPNVINVNNNTHQSVENTSPLRSPSPLSLVGHNGPRNLSSPNATLPASIAGQLLSNRHTTLGGLHSSPSALASAMPQSAGAMPQVAPLGHPNHPMMVAAAAAAAAASSAHQFSPMPSDYQQAAAFYPWFFRANPFAGRFAGVPFDSPLGSFLLPPFRKPKRIRTAFSPGQLLKLEQAFEKNHYVVGNERKQLANHLGLSETQVKVWFQNRRTKHKRQKQEDEESGPGSVNGSGEGGGANKDFTDDDDEEIDLEDDEESTSDQEHENQRQGGTNVAALNSFANMHHLWYQSMSAGLVSDTPPVSSSGST